MAFIKAGSLLPNSAPVLRKAVMKNSVTFVQNNSLKLASGFTLLSTSTTYTVFGHLDAIEQFAGTPVITTGVAGADIGTFVGSYLTASDNQTVAKVSAFVDISKFTLYSVSPSAAIGGTTGSNLLGYYTGLSDEANTLETSASTSASNTGYFIWGVDPIRSANQIVNIYSSLVFG